MAAQRKRRRRTSAQRKQASRRRRRAAYNREQKADFVTDTEFREYVRKLRKLAPLRKPARVVRAMTPTIAHMCGQCLTMPFSNGRCSHHIIRIRPTLARPAVVDTLIHEWAHARVAERYPFRTIDHGAAWAREYGRLYRLWIGEPDRPKRVHA